MTDLTATLEYIGSMADELAGMAKDVGQSDLVAMLRSAADLADRAWLEQASADTTQSDSRQP